MANALVPVGVAVVCRDARGDVGALFADERLTVARAIPSRQREYAAGRIAARAALAKLGHVPVAIPAGADRAPVWPRGFIGSISHCQTAAVAVAGRIGLAIAPMGVDVEEAVPLQPELWETICVPSEMEWLKGHAPAGLWAKVIFSVKEAVYKAQYPLTGRMLEFQQVEITALDPTGGFVARVLVDRALAIDGRFGINDDYILSFAKAWIG